MAMSIFDALKKDHEKVKGLFKQVQRKKQEASSVFPQIQEELQRYLAWEEKSFYPFLMNQHETHELTMESIEEHNVTKKELEEMSKMSFDDEWFQAKMKVLHELVDHHIEEEESQLFKKAKKLIGKQQAEEMAVEFEETKHRMPSATIKSQQSEHRPSQRR